MKKLSSKRNLAKKMKKSAIANVGQNKVKKFKQRKEYEYCSLADLVEKEKDRLNLYTVVYDCSSPYYLENIQKYVCTMKLIDSSLNPSNAKKGQHYMRTTVFAQSKGEIPDIAKVGSIFRIHRGQTHHFESKKNILQLNCDVGIKSAWVLFDPSESTNPLSNSGRTFTFLSADKERLKKIREFSKKFFEKNGIEGTSIKEAEKKGKDADFLGYVIAKKTKGKNDSLTLIDGTKKMKLNVKSEKASYIQPFDVVKVRSANLKTKEFEMSEYSKILRVPKEYKSAVDLMKKINENKEMKSEMEISRPHIEKHEVISKPLRDSKMKVSSLKNLFGGEGVKGKKYRINANIIEIGPKDPKDCIKVVNTKNNKQYNLDDIFTSGVSKLPDGMKYYLKMQFFVKDQSVNNDNNLYIIFLCTYDGKGSEFFKFPLTGREKPSEKTLKEMKKTFKRISRPWVSVDMIVDAIQVEGGNPVFFVTDTALTL